MCGLFGAKFQPGRIDQVRLAIVMATLADSMDSRGGDSWGVYSPDGDRLIKGLGTAIGDFDAVEVAKYPTIIGHTRMGTTGENTIANAHPFFMAGRKLVIGAHNGIVWNDEELNRRYNRNFEVDSMHIFQHIADELPLSEIGGYGAITYVDSDAEDDRVYMGTFNNGELAVARVYDETKETIGIVWASTPEALSRALNMAKLNYGFVTVKDGLLHYTTADQFYVTPVELDFMGLAKTKTKKKKLTKKERKRMKRMLSNIVKQDLIEKKQEQVMSPGASKYRGLLTGETLTGDEVDEDDFIVEVSLASDVEHESCSFCDQPIVDAVYRDMNWDAFCEGCAENLFDDCGFQFVPEYEGGGVA